MKAFKTIVGMAIVGFIIGKNPLTVGADYLKPIAIEKPVTTIKTVETVTTVEEEPVPLYRIPVTDAEYDLMARVVMSESSLLNEDGKQAVATTIVNRVLDGRWGDTVTDVINYPNAYSTGDNGEPTAECYRAVESALLYEGFPLDMFYFRSGYPHSFGYSYVRIGNMYFSTETEY